MMSFADAIIQEDLQSIQHMLRQGVDVNELDEYGFTPLIEAAIANNTDIAALLVAQGADVNQQDITGGTALHWSAENNNLALTELLLTHRANPNAYNFAGQPVLAMPVLRNQQGIKKLLQRHGADLIFAQDFVNTKLLGHMFELIGTADIVDPQNHFVEIDFEGFFLESTLSIISHSLAQFENHFAARKLRRFEPLTHITIDALNRAAQLMKYQQYQIDLAAHDAKIQLLLSEEPLLIPIGYEGHAITFVKLGNILAKCDRREDSRLYDNIMFYRINRPAVFSKEFIKRFIYEKKSSDFVNDELPQLLDLQPLTELKIEAQVSGNCSWANVEAAIPTIFFMLFLVSNEKDIARNKSNALDFFHQWREWNKDRALQFCIQSFKEGKPVRNACKAELLAAILFQCCRYQNMANNQRIDSILTILTQPQYEYVLKNYIQTYCYESQSEEGKAFKNLLQAWGYL
jgi:hypothetical protein